MTRLRFFPALIVFGAVTALSVVSAGCTGSSTTSPSATTLTKTDVIVGTGATAASGNTLTVQYTGWLYDASKPDSKGLQFDTSANGTAFVFILGSGQVIDGWEQGVPGMQVGGVRRLVVPPSLAYGSIRSGKIPPNAALVFDIELVALQ